MALCRNPIPIPFPTRILLSRGPSITHHRYNVRQRRLNGIRRRLAQRGDDLEGALFGLPLATGRGGGQDGGQAALYGLGVEQPGQRLTGGLGRAADAGSLTEGMGEGSVRRLYTR